MSEVKKWVVLLGRENWQWGYCSDATVHLLKVLPVGLQVYIVDFENGVYKTMGYKIMGCYRQQQSIITFCVLLQKSPCKTLKLLIQAYKDEMMKKSQVYEWRKHFPVGCVWTQPTGKSTACGRNASTILKDYR